MCAREALKCHLNLALIFNISKCVLYAFFIGGWNGNALEDVRVITLYTNDTIIGPPLEIARYDHLAVLFLESNDFCFSSSRLEFIATT